MNLSEIMIAGTMIMTGLGALYALRRQGHSFQVFDNMTLQQRVEQLETANRYLLRQLEEQQVENRREIDALKKDNELLRGLLMDVQQEARILKEQRQNYLDELAGLRSALKQSFP